MPDETVTLTITMDRKGVVAVSGPIDNRVMCYGMMEIAKDIIQQRGQNAPKRPTSDILIPKLHLGNGQ